MKLLAVELRRVHMPMVSEFRSHNSVEADHEAIIVRAQCDEGVGWGECAVQAAPTYWPEFLDEAWLTLERFLVPRLLSVHELEAEAVGGLLASFKGHNMAKAALETAVLDAQLRSAGVSLQSYLGGTAKSVVPGVAVGMADTVEELLAVVGDYLESGYRRVKLKIEPGWDIGPVRAVRERFGDELMLQVDANCAYRLSDADHLAQLDRFSLLLIEQPLTGEDLIGHSLLAARLKTPICLDESITSAAAAAVAIELGACSIINIKAGRLGGYIEARKVHDLCLSRGLPVFCGGMLETGIGRAANLALSSLPGFTLPGDLSASERYFRRDLTQAFRLVSGAIEVPTGPGLGVDVLIPVLDAVTTRRSLISQTA